jgi:hypothetical protein
MANRLATDDRRDRDLGNDLRDDDDRGGTRMPASCRGRQQQAARRAYGLGFATSELEATRRLAEHC